MASTKGMAVYSFLWSFVLESKTRKKWSKSSLVGVDSRHKKLTHVDESELEINSRSGVEMLHHPFKTRFEIREKGWQPLSSSTFVTMATSWQCLHKNFAKHATRSFCHLYVQFIVMINYMHDQHLLSFFHKCVARIPNFRSQCILNYN